jgi:hypothetical protein
MLRTTPLEVFTERVVKLPEIKSMILNIKTINKRIGDKYFPKKHEVDKNLSRAEQDWMGYFHSHSFTSINETRNLADAITLLTGINVNKYISISKPAFFSFVSGMCIVPLKNPNSHNYEIGYTILNVRGSEDFFRSDGTSGNSMHSSLSSFRLASDDEIVAFIAELLYTAKQENLDFIFGRLKYEIDFPEDIVFDLELEGTDTIEQYHPDTDVDEEDDIEEDENE